MYEEKDQDQSGICVETKIFYYKCKCLRTYEVETHQHYCGDWPLFEFKDFKCICGKIVGIKGFKVEIKEIE